MHRNIELINDPDRRAGSAPLNLERMRDLGESDRVLHNSLGEYLSVEEPAALDSLKRAFAFKPTSREVRYENQEFFGSFMPFIDEDEQIYFAKASSHRKPFVAGAVELRGPAGGDLGGKESYWYSFPPVPVNRLRDYAEYLPEPSKSKLTELLESLYANQ